MTPFNLTRDINGYNGFGLPFSEDIWDVALGVSTDTTVTVPAEADYYLAIMTYEPGSSVWVALNNTAVVPSSGTFVESNSEYLPVARRVKANDVLHFIAPVATYATVVFYALP